MFNLIVTALSEMITSLNLTRPLNFMSIIVVLMLMGSVSSIIALMVSCIKLGVYQHIKEAKATTDS